MTEQEYAIDRIEFEIELVRNYSEKISRLQKEIKEYEKKITESIQTIQKHQTNL